MTSSRTNQRNHREAFLLFIVVLPIYILTMSGHHYSVDGMGMYQQAKTILFRGTLEFSPPFVWNDYSASYTFWPEGLSFAYLVPLAICGFVVFPHDPSFRVVPGQNGLMNDPSFIHVSVTNPIITAVTVSLTYLLAIRLGATRKMARTIAIVYAIASPALAYQKQDFGQPLAALFLTAATLCVVVALSRTSLSQRAIALAGTGSCLGGLLLTRSETLFTVAPIFVLYFVLRSWKRGWREVATGVTALLLPLLCFDAFHAWISFLKTGSVFGIPANWITEVGGPQTWLTAAAGLLVSPGRGLFIYFPLALYVPWGMCRMWRRERAPESLLIVGLAATSLALFSIWPQWWGGYSWGPRFFVPLLPLLVIAAFRVEASEGESESGFARAALVLRPFAIAWGFLSALTGTLLNWRFVQASHMPPASSSSWPLFRQSLWLFRPTTNELLTNWRDLFRPDTWDLLLLDESMGSMVFRKAFFAVLITAIAGIVLAALRRRSPKPPRAAMRARKTVG